MEKTAPVKKKITAIIESLPDDATYDEIMKELAFERMVERGMADIRANKTLSNDEMATRIKSWQK